MKKIKIEDLNISNMNKKALIEQIGSDVIFIDRPTRRSLALKLYYDDGMSIKMIARRINCTENHVYKLISNKKK